jgi:methylenetetrahydrofolate reductase (NADPH)
VAAPTGLLTRFPSMERPRHEISRAARLASQHPRWHRVPHCGPTIEVIPLKGADEEVLRVPQGSTVTITCSPKFVLDRSLEHVESALRHGFTVVPHLAARMVQDDRQLRRFVRQVTDLGVDDLYVIAGDADEANRTFTDAESILLALREFDHGLRRIGVGCYPEGHPKIADDALLEALLRKQEHADYMVSQLCFDPATLVDWLTRARHSGVALPLRIRLAAPLKTAKLAELALKIGVGQSMRYLRKQRGMVSNLVLGRSYAPEWTSAPASARPSWPSKACTCSRSTRSRPASRGSSGSRPPSSDRPHRTPTPEIERPWQVGHDDSR